MTTDTVGGVWTYSLELARALHPHGVEVALATMGAMPTGDQLEEARSIGNVRLHISGYRLEWMDDPWDDVEQAGQWLLDIEESERADLVHLNGYCHGALDWRTPHLIAGHSCVLSWWQAVNGEPAPERWDRYRHEVAQGLRNAPLVIAPTETMLSALDHYYGSLPNARVVPNARNSGQFRAGPKEPLVLAAGRVWDEAKNIAALARIAPMLHWPVCVAGEEAHPDGGRARLENVTPLGRLAGREMAHWLARASIYALPARYEPFGLSALEAGLSGCALVLGDIPSLREVWGPAAVFVPPDDDEALSQAINGLIADTVWLNEMSDRAWIRAREYTPERMAREYLAAIRHPELVSGSVVDAETSSA